MTQDWMEQIYREMPPGDIPWNTQALPKPFVELVESGEVTPCTTIDLGCGAGNHAVWLAGRGFNVTGVDFAPSAIELARENAENQGVSCRFLVADLLGGLPEVAETFAFAYDWAVLHHIFPEARPQYVETVCRLLEPGGKYLSACFSEEDAGFGSTEKYRKTPLGTVLYFSSLDELRSLFEPHFTIARLATVQVEGKTGGHLMNCAWMRGP
ncbi:MAG: methyltransferase type 12 [Planctomycetes bacterium RBG_13_63_9]|nr:MAG: methyltransferase type 12 [Planctomycetes bacterium RBG_13_63_9]